jgi:hypothetical protein
MAARLTPEAQALVGKKVHVTKTTPDKTYLIALPGVNPVTPALLFKGKILEHAFPTEGPDTMRATIPIHLKVEVDGETQAKWGLDSPIMEWAAAPENLPIFELPSGGRRSRGKTSRRGGRRRATLRK